MTSNITIGILKFTDYNDILEIWVIIYILEIWIIIMNHNDVVDIDDDLIEMTLNTSHGRISS